MHNACSHFLGKWGIWGVDSGRFPEKTPERGWFVVIANGNQYSREWVFHFTKIQVRGTSICTPDSMRGGGGASAFWMWQWISNSMKLALNPKSNSIFLKYIINENRVNTESSNHRHLKVYVILYEFFMSLHTHLSITRNKNNAKKNVNQ